MPARASQRLAGATRAPRPFAAAATARRFNNRRRGPPASSTPLLPPPSRVPSPSPGDQQQVKQQQQQQQPEAPPQQQLRQLYSFAPEDAGAGTAANNANNAGRASPPDPLLFGTLPPREGDDGHHVYFEVRGNPRGLPALVMHGGPGAGSYPSHARFFDPERFCIVLLDQRGCGRSAPLGGLRGNSAAALVTDAERLRQHLGVARWACVLGGSWGACLALFYALRQPESVRALVLRAVCTMRPGPEEVGWLYRGGRGGSGAALRKSGGADDDSAAASSAPAAAPAAAPVAAVAVAGGAGALRPQAWAAFLAHVGITPEGVLAGREDPLPAYYERLLGDRADPKQLAARDAAASAWMAYEWAVYSTRAEDQALLSAAQEADAGDAGDAENAENAPPPPPLPPLSPELAARGLDFPGVCPPGASPTRADYSAAQALLLCHYSLHGGFVNRSDQGGPTTTTTLLAQLAAAAASGRLAPVSCSAFHGASDAVCPPSNARDLQRAWPEARVSVLPGPVGHSMYDPALVDAVVRATDAAADDADADAAADAAGGAAPLRARRLEEELARGDAELASAAAALTRA